eukprot:CAMPEP_0197524918 /NCGR_PEP_ID=MMETSP1318-20131121/10344_1 /TAXON_ID=552666 /ORGANISM="Partenskyella glossopodia, Strain RCC365" /LENGTH=226 /DNA_ID=CAMNT_0043078017 /DNA_START=221 /DNA_END=898 /DNA_ORIENTATION=+
MTRVWTPPKKTNLSTPAPKRRGRCLRKRSFPACSGSISSSQRSRSRRLRRRADSGTKCKSASYTNTHPDANTSVFIFPITTLDATEAAATRTPAKMTLEQLETHGSSSSSSISQPSYNDDKAVTAWDFAFKRDSKIEDECKALLLYLGDPKSQTLAPQPSKMRCAPNPTLRKRTTVKTSRLGSNPAGASGACQKPLIINRSVLLQQNGGEGRREVSSVLKKLPPRW